MVPETARALFPYFAAGSVVRGFGRGGKQLNCPTANLPEHVVEALPADVPCGVYFGWASVGGGAVQPMCMSIGYNPQFKNTKKTMETHILHDFGRDFYGELLKIAILGFIREMSAFSDLESLTAAIEEDKKRALAACQDPAAQALLSHPFFQPGGEKLATSPHDFSISSSKNNPEIKSLV